MEYKVVMSRYELWLLILELRVFGKYIKMFSVTSRQIVTDGQLAKNGTVHVCPLFVNVYCAFKIILYILESIHSCG
jgi:hypothetical protein